VQEKRISKVVMTHRDRLARFAFDLVQLVFKNYGTDVEVMFADEDSTPQDELVKDLITIITSLAGRLYGLRSHKMKRLIQTVKEVVQSPPQ